MKSKVIKVDRLSDFCNEPEVCKYLEKYNICSLPTECPERLVVKVKDLEFALKKFEDWLDSLFEDDTDKYYVEPFIVRERYRRMKRELGLGSEKEVVRPYNSASSAKLKPKLKRSGKS